MSMHCKLKQSQKTIRPIGQCNLLCKGQCNLLCKGQCNVKGGTIMKFIFITDNDIGRHADIIKRVCNIPTLFTEFTCTPCRSTDIEIWHLDMLLVLSGCSRYSSLLTGRYTEFQLYVLVVISVISICISVLNCSP